jgi:hypothetical protein
MNFGKAATVGPLEKDHPLTDGVKAYRPLFL